MLKQMVFWTGLLVVELPDVRISSCEPNDEKDEKGEYTCKELIEHKSRDGWIPVSQVLGPLAHDASKEAREAYAKQLPGKVPAVIDSLGKMGLPAAYVNGATSKLNAIKASK